MKRRGGKQSVVQLSDQKDVFIEYKEYFKDFHNLPAASEQIFAIISKELQGKMTEKALCVSLKRNYNFFFIFTTQTIVIVN